MTAVRIVNQHVMSKMKLFNRREECTDAGDKLHAKLSAVIAPIVKEAVKSGCKIRNIEYIINTAAAIVCMKELSIKLR